jgi:hypothetical protein
LDEVADFTPCAADKHLDLDNRPPGVSFADFDGLNGAPLAALADLH